MSIFERNGLTNEPYFWTHTDLNDGEVLVVGEGGSESGLQPGKVLSQFTVYNSGSYPVFIGTTLSGTVSGNSKVRVPAGGSRTVNGETNQILILNESGSGGSTGLDIAASKLVGRQAIGNAHGDWSFCIPTEASATVTFTVTASFACVVDGVYTYSSVPRGSSAGSYTATVYKNADYATGSVNLLSGSSIDLESISSGTLEAHTLSTSGSYLSMSAGDTLTVRAISDNGDLTDGDLVIGVSTTW